jgi:D-arabinose 1-dehydrogenase-like Zn-dependent alcohol dehydrogenase
MGPLITGLATRDRLIVVGASNEPIQVNPVQLIVGALIIVEGSVTGTAIDIEDTLTFGALEKRSSDHRNCFSRKRRRTVRPHDAR